MVIKNKQVLNYIKYNSIFLSTPHTRQLPKLKNDSLDVWECDIKTDLEFDMRRYINELEELLFLMNQTMDLVNQDNHTLRLFQGLDKKSKQYFELEKQLNQNKH